MSDPSTRPSLPPAKILLIDPHKDDREYWAQRLTIASPDFVVLEADTGASGLVNCQSQQVDCVVTEVMLPDMSGFQLLVTLVPRAFHPDTAVIFLSRLSLPPMERLAKNNGAQAYLVKSQISGDDLDMAIRKAMNAVSLKRKALRL